MAGSTKHKSCLAHILTALEKIGEGIYLAPYQEREYTAIEYCTGAVSQSIECEVSLKALGLLLEIGGGILK